MRQGLFLAALAAALLACVSAARMTPLMDVQKMVVSSDDSLLRSASQAFANVFKRKEDEDEDEDEDKKSHTAYMAVKYIVPPSEGQSFEDRWEKLKDQAEKEHGEDLEVHTLKRAKLTNVLYYEYAEFNGMNKMHKHFNAKHFKDFAEWVDDHGVKWELEILKSLSDDIEEEAEEGKHGDAEDEYKTFLVGNLEHKCHCHHCPGKGEHGCHCGCMEEEKEQGPQVLSSTSARLEHKCHCHHCPGKGEHGCHCGCESKKDKEQEEQDQQDDHADDWDKFVPEEYRHFIPKNVRPKKDTHHKKHGKKDRRSELGAALNLPQDASPQQIRDALRSLTRRKGGEEHAHVLVAYFVPPGEGEGFVDAWTDAAELTIKEEGNMVYSLRKVATDNTRFYCYGTWDSLDSYMEHFDSKHLGKFVDYTSDNDITWVIIPLEEVGGDEE